MKSVRVLALLALAAGCSGGGDEEPGAEAQGEEGTESNATPDVLRERYTITTSGTNVDGELCINGACIASWTNGSDERTLVLDGWLLPGRNAVTVALAASDNRPPPRSFRASVDRERWYADTARGVLESVLEFHWPIGVVYDLSEERRLRREHLEPRGLEEGVVRALEDGTYPSNETLKARGVAEPESLIGELDARIEEHRASVRAKTVEHELPHAYQLAFEVEVDLGTELWTRAEAVELSDEDREELLSMLAQLHSAVAQRRLKDVVELLTYAAVDTGRAQEQPEDHATRALEFRLKRLFGRKRGYRVSKLKPRELVFEALASRKLVTLTHVDGSPPITVRSREGQAAFQPYFARVDGRWLIARTNEI